MGLLNEYAITPDVFSDAVDCESSLHNFRRLKDILLSSGVVRNLYDGAWKNFIEEMPNRNRDRLLFLAKLYKQNRLISYPPISRIEPRDDVQWLREAISSSAHYSPLEAIITCKISSKRVSKDPLIIPIETMHNSNQIAEIECSQKVKKLIPDYIKALDLILKCSRSVMFIDPYINPTRSSYKGFLDAVLISLSKRPDKPLIEVHTCQQVRVNGYGSQVVVNLEEDFRQEWNDLENKYGFSVNVYVHDKFHDRYLISDIIGISLPFGFQTSTNNDDTIWTKLQREHRDYIQHYFDSARAICHFRIT